MSIFASFVLFKSLTRKLKYAKCQGPGFLQNWDQQGTTWIKESNEPGPNKDYTDANINSIDILTTVRVKEAEKQKRKPVLTHITCFKEVEKSQFLPSFMVTNVRSLGPKINNFIEEFK